jgi:hypothetical protein
MENFRRIIMEAWNCESIRCTRSCFIWISRNVWRKAAAELRDSTSAKRLIASSLKNRKPVVLVLFTGRPLVILHRKWNSSSYFLNTWLPQKWSRKCYCWCFVWSENWKLTATFQEVLVKSLFITIKKNIGKNRWSNKESSKIQIDLYRRKKRTVISVWFWRHSCNVRDLVQVPLRDHQKSWKVSIKLLKGENRRLLEISQNCTFYIQSCSLSPSLVVLMYL